MSVGEAGCQRTVSPFSRSRIRHCSRSRSAGRRASAPPRRQAVSVCSRRISVSSSGSSPVVAAIWLISASLASFTARRVYGRRRGHVLGEGGDFRPLPGGGEVFQGQSHRLQDH